MKPSIRCSLREDCELLKRLASNTRHSQMYGAIAKALIENELVATTLHAQFGVDPLMAVRLAKVFSEARRSPPSNCACARVELVA